MNATDDLREFAREDPETVRSFAAKVDEPIKGRLLRLLDKEEGMGSSGEGIKWDGS